MSWRQKLERVMYVYQGFKEMCYVRIATKTSFISFLVNKFVSNV